MRVLLSVPIHVSGKDKEQQDFTEETRTLVVNAHGALISLGAKVTPGQQITVANRSTRMQLECRVVHLGNATAGKVQTGVEFLSACGSFWQIDFPPDDWVTPED
jgi:PilZ domain